MEINYLVVDMGTGNSRVGLVGADGTIWGIRNYENQYYKDKQYEDAQYFLPEEWEQNLLDGCKELLEEFPDHPVRAITSSCCSLVSLIKFTAYPETRIVSCGYCSGCFCASKSVSRFNTLTFK